jgi:DNA-binding NarL/FixJ family response regulator
LLKIPNSDEAQKEIGTLLKQSPATVIWHRKNIRKKLGIAETKKNLRSTILSRKM